MKLSTSLVFSSLVLGLGVTACGEGADDGTGGSGGSTGGFLATGGVSGSGGGDAAGGAPTGGSSAGGAGGTGSSPSGGTGGANVEVGCPEVEPSGDCTDWANANTPEICAYVDTQCYCQTGQQGAEWMCGTCPETPTDGTECPVTEMTCGACVCEMEFIQGGQREWTFACE